MEFAPSLLSVELIDRDKASNKRERGQSVSSGLHLPGKEANFAQWHRRRAKLVDVN